MGVYICQNISTIHMKCVHLTIINYTAIKTHASIKKKKAARTKELLLKSNAEGFAVFNQCSWNFIYTPLLDIY